MARLPQPGSDKGTWGDILNDFLSTSHNADGSLKPVASTNVSGLATVAMSGSYADLANKPTIPTQASDIGAITSSQVDTKIAAQAAADTATYAPLTDVWLPSPSGSAATDTTAITAAVASSTLSTPKHIRFRAGEYLLNLELTVPFAPGTTFSGAGRYQTKLTQTVAGKPVFAFRTDLTHSITVEDMTVGYSTAQTDPASVAFTYQVPGGSDGGFFHHNYRRLLVSNAYDGFAIADSDGKQTLWDTKWEDIQFAHTARRLFSFNPASPVGIPSLSFDRITAYDAPTVAGATAFVFTACEVNMANLDIEGWIDTVVSASGGGYCRIEGIHVEHHVLSGASSAIFEVSANTLLKVDTFSISGATTSTNTDSAVIFSAGASAYLAIGNGYYMVDATAGSAYIKELVYSNGNTFTFALGNVYQASAGLNYPGTGPRAAETGAYLPTAGVTSYNDLTDKPTIPTAADIANAGFADVPAANVTLATRAKWRKAIGGVVAGVSNAKLLIVGDSTDWGLGSSGADGAPPSKSLATLLDRSFVSTQYAFAVPPGTSAPTADGDRDDRWSKNTVDGWADTTWGAAGLGAFQHSGTSTSTAKTLTPGTACDTFVIYYLQNSGLGTLAISVDGGTVTNQSCVGSGTLGIASVTVTSTLSSSHVLSIVKSVNTCFILGVKFYDSTKKSVHVLNAGICDSRAYGTIGQWSNSATGNALDFIGAMAPDLTIIRLGINDARLSGSSSAANWETAIRAIIAKAQVTGDVVLASVIPSDPAVLQNGGSGPGTAVALEQAYRDASLNIATSTGSTYLNLFDRYGSYSASNGAGYMYDSLHLTASGSADAAEAMRRVLVN